MTSLNRALMDAHVLAVTQRLGACGTIDELRQAYETYPLDSSLLPSMLTRRVKIPSGYWVGRQEFDDARRGVYLHGGGFLAGSFEMYRGLVSRIADATRSWVFFCDYPLAPEHLFPAAHDAAINACMHVESNGPRDSSQASLLFAAGDSCGGGLALGVAMHFRDHDRRNLLNVVVGLSPTLDFTASGDSYIRCATTDKVVSAELTRQCAQGYAPGIDSGDPRLSPLFGSFEGLPPILLQVGEGEVVHDDSVRAADATRKCGGHVVLQQWPDMPHVWHLFAGTAREADGAISEVASFIDQTSCT